MLDLDEELAIAVAHGNNLLRVCDKGHESLNKMVNEPKSHYISKRDLEPKAVTLQISSLFDKHDMDS